MPRRDGTGPMGAGAMTGRGAGICNAAKAVGIVGGLGLGLGLGRRGARGAGRGLGRGLGQGLGFNSANSPVDRKSALKEQKDILENSLNLIKEELESLNK